MGYRSKNRPEYPRHRMHAQSPCGVAGFSEELDFVQPISRNFLVEKAIRNVDQGRKEEHKTLDQPHEAVCRAGQQVDGNDSIAKAGVQTLSGSHRCENLPSGMISSSAYRKAVRMLVDSAA